MTKGTVIRHGGVDLVRPATDGDVIASLARGVSVEILEEQTWLTVRTGDGQVGRVLADFVELAPEALDESAIAEESAVSAPSDRCEIRRYRNDRFEGKELRADVDFFPFLDRLNDFATRCGVHIHVTSSARDPGRDVHGAIVPPAGRSNHLVGHAIDMNLRSASGFFNSKALQRDALAQQPEEIRGFIDMVRADPELRWGGDFTREDPIHIDDALNHRFPAIWDAKLSSRA